MVMEVENMTNSIYIALVCSGIFLVYCACKK